MLIIFIPLQSFYQLHILPGKKQRRRELFLGVLHDVEIKGLVAALNDVAVSIFVNMAEER